MGNTWYRTHGLQNPWTKGVVQGLQSFTLQVKESVCAQGHWDTNLAGNITLGSIQILRTLVRMSYRQVVSVRARC